jgi:sarcosine oxidase delta subunit
VPSYAEQLIADEFEYHQARAGRPIVSAREAQEAWDNGFLPRRNARGSPNTRLLIGRTDGGRRVTLVSRHLGDGMWLTFTAWDTKEADLA